MRVRAARQVGRASVLEIPSALQGKLSPKRGGVPTQTCLRQDRGLDHHGGGCFSRRGISAAQSRHRVPFFFFFRGRQTFPSGAPLGTVPRFSDDAK